MAKTVSHLCTDWAGMPFGLKRQENHSSLNKQDLWPNKIQRENKVMAYAGMLFTLSLVHSHLNFPLAGRKETDYTETLEFVAHANKRKTTLKQQVCSSSLHDLLINTGKRKQTPLTSPMFQYGSTRPDCMTPTSLKSETQALEEVKEASLWTLLSH